MRDGPLSRIHSCETWYEFRGRLVNYTRAVHRVKSHGRQYVQPSPEEKEAAKLAKSGVASPVCSSPSKEAQTQPKKVTQPSKANQQSDTKSANQGTTPCQGCGRTGHTREKCALSKHPDFNSANQTWKASKNGVAWAGHATYPSQQLPFRRQLSGEELPQEHLDAIGKLNKISICFDCSSLQGSDTNSDKAFLVPIQLLIDNLTYKANMLVDLVLYRETT